MPSFKVRSRTTGPLVDKDVDAESREHAIDQVIKEATDADSTVEITDVKEIEVQDAKAAAAAHEAHHSKKEAAHHGKK